MDPMVNNKEIELSLESIKNWGNKNNCADNKNISHNLNRLKKQETNAVTTINFVDGCDGTIEIMACYSSDSADEECHAYNEEEEFVKNMNDTIQSQSKLIHEDVAMKRLPCCAVALYNILIFLFLLGTSMLLFVLADILLTTESTRSGATQSEWDSRWWSMPPLQLTFYIAVMLSCCSLTLRCGRKSKVSGTKMTCKKSCFKMDTKKKILIQRLIAVFFVLIIGSIVLLIPDVTQRIKVNPYHSVHRGNCTSSLDVINNGGKLCPSFSKNPHYFQVRSNLPFLTYSGGKKMTDQNIKDVFFLIEKLDE
jgi:hypothetical protein